MISSLYIALKYFGNSKVKHVVNLVSYISWVGVAIITACLVIILSVVNGFEKQVVKTYNSYYPDIEIKSVNYNTFDAERLTHILLELGDHIKVSSSILEERALLFYNNVRVVSNIIGADRKYLEILTNQDTSLIKGFLDEKSETSILGNTLMFSIGANVFATDEIECYVPKSESKVLTSLDDFKIFFVRPTSYITKPARVDDNFIIMPLTNVQKILDKKNQISSIQIDFNEGSDLTNIKEKIASMLEEEFVVITKYEQNKFLYKLLNSEKLITFIILIFVLLLIFFNVISSISMLIIHKKSDIKILSFLGASKSFIRWVFFYKGFLGVFFGSIIGISFGILISFVQSYFSIIKFRGAGDGSLIPYPINISFYDVFLIELIVLIMGTCITFIPTILLVNKIVRKQNL
ncbi:MAG: hypothetical protein CMP51_02920 [Flavobacteriales bacterium]|nr:hypothetical protein [Flavobacteriales bacterium]